MPLAGSLSFEKQKLVNKFSITTNPVFSRGETFYKTFGGYEGDSGNCVQQTSDDGYIIVGYKGDCIWLIKTDSAGNKEWNTTLDTTPSPFNYDYYVGTYVQQTNDGGYIISGYFYFDRFHYHLFLLYKTDSTGNIQWYQVFERSMEDLAYCVQQTNDYGYIIVGQSDLYGAEKDDVWLIKTNGNGYEQWDKTFHRNNDDHGYYVQQTTDYGYIIVGETGGIDDNDIDIWLIKTDSDGNMLWDRTFGGTDIDSGRCVQQTSDEGYIITGTKDGYICLIKTDSAGNIVWDNPLEAGTGNYVQQTSDGGYIITGEGWLIKTDSAGNIIWKKTFPYDALGLCVRQTTDGGYIITGNVEKIFFNPDVCLIKTDENGKARNKISTNSLFLRFLERFPNVFQILKYVLGGR